MKKTIIYLIILISQFFLIHKINSSEIEIYKKIDLFGEVLEKINKEYVDEINQSESMDSAINGLLQSLDPYSAYMTPKIFNEMQTDTSGEFGGLGIEVSMEAGVVKVISPIDDTPASKAGIIGFTKSIALELGGRNIRCNGVARGFISTEMTEKINESELEEWKKSISLKREGLPEDVANICIFLASDQSSYITGQIIKVDGGMVT